MSSLTPEQRSEITFTNIDTSDCAVVAVQAITRLPRKDVEDLMSLNGYHKVTGTPRSGTHKALHSLGFKLRELETDRTDTPATFAMSHERGLYLIHIKQHVMALVEGDLHNSRGHWGSPVEQILEVTR